MDGWMNGRADRRQEKEEERGGLDEDDDSGAELRCGWVGMWYAITQKPKPKPKPKQT
jgi:hypothetical protein